ncbi:hypothetical protein FQZ97_782330 [compost metagenome]
MGRVVLVAPVPDHVHRQRGAGRGHLGAGELAHEAVVQQGRRRGQQRAATQESGQAAKARHHDGKAPVQALRGERAVQVERAPGFVDHGDVIGGKVVGQRGRGCAHRRVVVDAVAVFEDALLHDVAALGRARADGDVAHAVAQHLQARDVRGDDAQRHAGRLRAQHLRQRGQQHVALEVVGGDGDGGLPACGVEGAGVRKALQLAQQFARLHGQFTRARRGDDAAPAFHEQCVAGDAAQLVELVAHGRLRDAQRLRRAGDAARLHHRHQQLQQAGIQI